MIEVQKITKKYGNLEVLRGVDLSISKGEVVSIVGASGAGKSTLLHIIGTLDRPDAGKVLYDGVEISRLNGRDLARFRNKNIGFIFQFHNLLPEFTALENVCIPAYIGKTGSKGSRKSRKRTFAFLGSH
jgi:lipoprotein-releasing system ATP-binding protein